jgi:hypothetical protein
MPKDKFPICFCHFPSVCNTQTGNLFILGSFTTLAILQCYQCCVVNHYGDWRHYTLNVAVTELGLTTTDVSTINWCGGGEIAYLKLLSNHSTAVTLKIHDRTPSLYTSSGIQSTRLSPSKVVQDNSSDLFERCPVRIYAATPRLIFSTIFRSYSRKFQDITSDLATTASSHIVFNSLLYYQLTVWRYIICNSKWTVNKIFWRACCRQYGVCLQQLLGNHATVECDAAKNMADARAAAAR